MQPVTRTEFLVSFLYLPAYVEEGEILAQLRQWGVVPLSAVGRRMYPWTAVADGTCYVSVRFPPTVASLPHSARFTTLEGPAFFRVVHDRQVCVCRLCLRPGHIFKTCPEFTCFECHEQGHFAHDCAAALCPDCKWALILCVCEVVLSGEVAADVEEVVVRGAASDGLREACDAPIAPSEVEEAIGALQVGRAPGSDGLPVEFYATFKDVLVPVLCYMYDAVFREGALCMPLDASWSHPARF